MRRRLGLSRTCNHGNISTQFSVSEQNCRSFKKCLGSANTMTHLDRKSRNSAGKDVGISFTSPVMISPRAKERTSIPCLSGKTINYLDKKTANLHNVLYQAKLSISLQTWTNKPPLAPCVVTVKTINYFANVNKLTDNLQNCVVTGKAINYSANVDKQTANLHNCVVTGKAINFSANVDKQTANCTTALHKWTSCSTLQRDTTICFSHFITLWLLFKKHYRK